MSTNLNLPQVVASQNQAEVTINGATGGVDAAMTETATYLITASNARTLTNAEFRDVIFMTIDEDGGSPATAAITLTVPAIKRGLFVVINDTAFDVTVTVSGQGEAAPVLTAGDRSTLSCDGSNVRLAGGGGGGAATNASFGIFFSGKPGDSELLSDILVTVDFDIPSGATNSLARCATTATSAATVDILKNGVSQGTANFAAGTNAGTFTFSSLVSWTAGDRIGFRGQTTADTTLADISITMKGTLT